ncbi:hypothetical protein Btru_050738 [Bulinus truncatus]|nr:hypothetical protein Btru_050738 [Bulinus truncatus]
MFGIIVACCSIRFPLIKAEKFWWTIGDMKNTPGNERCRGACGVWRPTPCSCNSKCLVFNSCCSDFEAECSHLEDEARQLYAHLIPSEVICTSGVFVITGCPRQAIRGAHVTADETSGGHTTVSDPSDTNWRQEYNLYLEEIPVIDLATGFSFANPRVLKGCGGSEWTMKMWNLVFQQIWVNSSQTASPTVTLKQYEFFNTVRHPDTPEVTNETHLCVSRSVGTCSEADSRHDLEAKCRSSSFSFAFHGNVFFNNKHCAPCNGINDIFPVNFESWVMERNFDLPVVVSMSGYKLTMKIELNEIRCLTRWRLMECFMTKNELQSCSEASCIEATEKRPDGLCKTPILVNLAISTGKSRSKRGISRAHLLFMHCCLTRVRRLDISDSWNRSVVNKINNFDETFHVFEFLLYEFEDNASAYQTTATNVDYLRHFRGVVSSLRLLMKAAERSSTGADQYSKNDHTGFGDRVCTCTWQGKVQGCRGPPPNQRCALECSDAISQDDKREFHKDISLCSWKLRSGVTHVHVLAVLTPVVILSPVAIFAPVTILAPVAIKAHERLRVWEGCKKGSQYCEERLRDRESGGVLVV